MNILEPQLIWIGGRCYRVNSTYSESDEENDKPEPAGYVEADLYDDDDDEEEDSDEIDIIPTENGSFKVSFHVPRAFFSHIIGTRGATKKRIEFETKVQIHIPKQGLEGDVVIIGPSRQSVKLATRKVNAIVLNSRKKHHSTHFICIPFNSPDIQKEYNKFREEVLSKFVEFDNILFAGSPKLHLTIGTLTLMDNADRALATEILNDCSNSVVKPILEKFDGLCYLELCGLEIMNDDPSAVDVLYAKVDSKVLQDIADQIVEKFASKELAQKRTEHVKMHVTLMNSKYRTDPDDEFSVQETFDARRILNNYSDYRFGTQQLTEIHLSQRYSTANDGFFQATRKIIIPDLFQKSD